MKNAFVQLFVHGVGGSLLGILSGFILSFLIRGLMMLVLTETADNEIFQVIHMLGMGFGAVLGGIFGGITGLKKV